MIRSTGTSGFDGAGSPPAARDRAPHRGQIDDRGDPREVLHQDAARHERDVRRRFGPRGERAHVLVRDVARTGATEEVLERGSGPSAGGGRRRRRPTRRAREASRCRGPRRRSRAASRAPASSEVIRWRPSSSSAVPSILPRRRSEPRRRPSPRTSVRRSRERPSRPERCRSPPCGRSGALAGAWPPAGAGVACPSRRAAAGTGRGRPAASTATKTRYALFTCADRPGERVLGLDPDPALHRGPADVVHACLEDDHLADVDGLEERHLVDPDGEGHAPGMLDRGQGGGRVHEAHDRAPVDVPGDVRVGHLHHLGEGHLRIGDGARAGRGHVRILRGARKGSPERR